MTSSQLRAGTERLQARITDAAARLADTGKIDILDPLVDAEDAQRARGS